MKQLRPTDLKRLHRDWSRRTTGRLAVLLDSVQSPYNIGAIVRTAAAYRVEHLYLCGQSGSPSAAKSAKVSLGTERYVSWSVFERGPDAADAAREEGFVVVGLELADAAVPLHQLTAGPDVCLALGNEDHGLSPATLAALTPWLSFPCSAGSARSTWRLRPRWGSMSCVARTGPDRTRDQGRAGQQRAPPARPPASSPFWAGLYRVRRVTASNWASRLRHVRSSSTLRPGATRSASGRMVIPPRGTEVSEHSQVPGPDPILQVVGNAVDAVLVKGPVVAVARPGTA